MAPLLKIAISVVPPPISTKHTPRFFSSSVKTEILEASCSRTTFSGLIEHFLIHFSILSLAFFAPVTR